MKKCPFCAEEIQDEAIKCRYCNEFLDENFVRKGKTKWYFSGSTIFVALISVGPLALPLIWFNPRYSTTIKIIYSIAIIAFFIWIFFFLKDAFVIFSDYWELLNNVGNN